MLPKTRYVHVLFLLCLLGPFVPAVGAEEPDRYNAEELQEIVGPIALFPDVVLASLLPAAAEPTDVVRAARWVEAQQGEITAPPENVPWDPAVIALVQFPDLLLWLNENLDWLEQLGFAMAVQQEEVLQAIQDFREKVDQAGNLESNEHVQIVHVENVIEIHPAQPTVVYIPRYDPVLIIRRGWLWPPGAWGVGFVMGAVGAWAWHGIWWGGWGRRGSVHIHRSPQFNFNNNGIINRGNIGSGNRWSSSNRWPQPPGRYQPIARPRPPIERGPRPGAGGVRPGGRPPATRPVRPGGRPGEGVGLPTRPPPTSPGERPGLGNRPGGGDRPSIGDRPGIGNRPGVGDRPGIGNGPGITGRPGLGNRPGGSDRPGIGSLPGGGAGIDRAPQLRPADRSLLRGSSNERRTELRAADRARASLGSRSGPAAGGRPAGAGAARPAGGASRPALGGGGGSRPGGGGGLRGR